LKELVNLSTLSKFQLFATNNKGTISKQKLLVGQNVNDLIHTFLSLGAFKDNFLPHIRLEILEITEIVLFF